MHLFKYIMGFFSYFIAPFFENDTRFTDEDAETLPPLSQTMLDQSEAETMPPPHSFLGSVDHHVSGSIQRSSRQHTTQASPEHSSDALLTHLTQSHHNQPAAPPGPVPYVDIPSDLDHDDGSHQFTVEDLELLSKLLHHATTRLTNPHMTELARKVEQTIFQSRAPEDRVEPEDRLLEDTYVEFHFSKDQLHEELKAQEQAALRGDQINVEALRDIFNQYLSMMPNQIEAPDINDRPSIPRRVTPAISRDQIKPPLFYGVSPGAEPVVFSHEDVEALSHDHPAMMMADRESLHELDEAEYEDFLVLDASDHQPDYQLNHGHQLKSKSRTRRHKLRVVKVNQVGLDYLIYIDQFRRKRYIK